MKMKIAGAIAGLALLGAISEASASVIDFNLPAGVQFFGPSYSQGGFRFTNSDGVYENLVAVGGGFAQYNADDTADIAVVFPQGNNTVTNNLGRAFSFTSIGLADFVPGADSNPVVFTFNHKSGPADVITVTLLKGVAGLQTFSFNEHNLTSVVFQSTSIFGQDTIQFDNVRVNPVPLPSTWAMMLVGLAGLSLIYGWTRKRSSATAAA
jgi:hypothetical protein